MNRRRLLRWLRIIRSGIRNAAVIAVLGLAAIPVFIVFHILNRLMPDER